MDWKILAYLVGYGTNDSGGSMPLLSGFGLDSADSAYAGSYKYYLQQIIDAVVLPPSMGGAGKLVFFAKIPPYLNNDSTRNGRVEEYNMVIDELVAQLKIDYPSRYLTYTPPDFHSYFTANQAELSSDSIHPNGTGYQSMGRLWCEALNGLQGWFCLDDDKDGLLNSLEALLGTDPLLADTDGDGLVDGNDGFVPVGNRKQHGPLHRQHHLGGFLGLEKRPSIGVRQAEDLAGGTHFRSQHGIDLREHVEREHRFLNPVMGDMLVRKLQVGEAFAQHDLGGQAGHGHIAHLGHDRYGPGGARVGLQHVDGVVVDGVLHVH